MNLYCCKTIYENGETIQKEEKIDDTFDEIIIAKLRKIRTQVSELKIIKKNNTKRYDEIIDEIEDIMKTYKNGQRIRKEWKLYENTFCIDINYKAKKFIIKKHLPHGGYDSDRNYFMK